MNEPTKHRSIAWLSIVGISACVASIFAALMWQGEREAQGNSQVQSKSQQPERPARLAEFKPFKVCPPIPAIVTPARKNPHTELTNADGKPETRTPPRDNWLLQTSEVQDEVNDNELVIGVVVDSEARAYPVNMLTGPEREIINDTLAGRNIAATW